MSRWLMLSALTLGLLISGAQAQAPKADDKPKDAPKGTDGLKPADKPGTLYVIRTVARFFSH